RKEKHMTSLRIMRDRDHEQDIQHALNELDHLTRWGMSREHALAKVGLTETLIEKAGMACPHFHSTSSLKGTTDESQRRNQGFWPSFVDVQRTRCEHRHVGCVR